MCFTILEPRNVLTQIRSKLAITINVSHYNNEIDTLVIFFLISLTKVLFIVFILLLLIIIIIIVITYNDNTVDLYLFYAQYIGVSRNKIRSFNFSDIQV